ncbi:MAG TPA: type II toxin-antitoxin system prevent-host-death family antitoxin [Stellaceae bacterium]|nr:type II toxin-antitoxin system prevent-host-death family antitoxin [Stellaceae bacterium]
MTEILNLYQAETQLSRLVERAVAGKEIVIAKAGKPKAKLVPFQPPAQPHKSADLLGIAFIAEDFDDPLPPEIAGAFAGEP